MTQLKLKNPADLDKWISQNNGIIEFEFPGSLLDNYLISCKRGVAAVWETYRNSNASDFMILFAPYTEKEYADKIHEEFMEKFDEYEKEFCLE